MQLNDNNFSELKQKKLGGELKNMPLIGHPEIKGYNFEKEFDLNSFIESYTHTGFQAANLGHGINIVNSMIRDKAKIYLTLTSNMISSGLREIITFLVKNKFIDGIVTSAGGIEEDIIKIKKPFVVGQFNASPKYMNDNGIFRTGNIFIPNDRYAYLELFVDPFLKKIYGRQKESGKVFSTHEFIHELGKELENEENHEESYLYWAYKNNIPVFCPGLVDGAIGDFIYFFKFRQKDFVLDTAGDIKRIHDMMLQDEKAGVICLGAGLPKHFLLNANILRDGLEYAVYINTAQEYDGCDSGARIQEAMTWYKVKLDALTTKIHADATLVFPLLVAATFKKEFDKRKK